MSPFLHNIYHFIFFITLLTCDIVQNKLSYEDLLLITTIGGDLIALNAQNGQLKWKVHQAPLISQSISKIEFLKDGTAYSIVPSLDGDMFTLDSDINGRDGLRALPITAETLFSAGHQLSSDVLVVGGKDNSAVMLDPYNGNMIYNCSKLGCENRNETFNENPMLLMKRNTQIVRGIYLQNGKEQWNFSVSHDVLSLVGLNTDDTNNLKSQMSMDWLFNVKSGVITGLTPLNEPFIRVLWQQRLTSPLHSVWHLIHDENGKALQLRQLSIFQNNELTFNTIEHVEPFTVSQRSELFRRESCNPSAAFIYQQFRNHFRFSTISSTSSKEIATATRNTVELNNIMRISHEYPDGIDGSCKTRRVLYLGKFLGNLYVQRETLILSNKKSGNGDEDYLYEDDAPAWMPILSRYSRKPTRSTVKYEDSSSMSSSLSSYASHFNVEGYDGGFLRESKVTEKVGEIIKKVDDVIWWSWGTPDYLQWNLNRRETYYDFEISPNILQSLFQAFWLEICAIMALIFLLMNLFISKKNEYFHVRKSRHLDAYCSSSSVENISSSNTTSYSSRKDPNFYQSRYLSDYQHISCLGRGGFGIVFQAKNVMDDCEYAVKRICCVRSHTVPNERLRREVRNLAKLEHPGIVRYYSTWCEVPPEGWQKARDIDLFISKNSHGTKFSGSLTQTTEEECGFSTTCNNSSFDNNMRGEKSRTSSTAFNIACSKETDESAKVKPHKEYHYIVMQICQKDSLKDRLFSRNRQYNSSFSQYKIHLYYDWFIQMVNAVAYIHSKHLIHRDLKPSNILFDFSDSIRIVDFGLVTEHLNTSSISSESLCLIEDSDKEQSKGDNSLVKHTKDVGTQLYMSPEQQYLQNYDNKIDVYALGLIFLELLVPFNTEMERHRILTDVKNATAFPNILNEAEKNLISIMTQYESENRPNCKEILMMNLFDKS